MTATHSRRHIAAPPERVYRLLTDRDAVQRWRVPDGMTSRVHEFDPREGGSFRVSLTYASAEPAGKTSAHTDTYHGRFVSLLPHACVVERMAFETDDPAMAGEMTITYTLLPSGSGTDLLAVHEGLPAGVSAADNELGWRMALDKLAALAEGQAGTAGAGTKACHEPPLPLGHRRGRQPAGLCRDGRDVLAARLPAADGAGTPAGRSPASPPR
jgi:uncharacterized protein YndB with AHSA1/START domain